MQKLHHNYTSFSAIAFLIVFQFVFFIGFAQKNSAMRTKTNINENWLYLENHTSSLSEAKNAANW